jgi:hypothetical protein
MFCPRTALSQGPFCPRGVSLQNFWDEKSIGSSVHGHFVRVPPPNLSTAPHYNHSYTVPYSSYSICTAAPVIVLIIDLAPEFFPIYWPSSSDAYTLQYNILFCPLDLFLVTVLADNSHQENIGWHLPSRARYILTYILYSLYSVSWCVTGILSLTHHFINTRADTMSPQYQSWKQWVWLNILSSYFTRRTMISESDSPHYPLMISITQLRAVSLTYHFFLLYDKQISALRAVSLTHYFILSLYINRRAKTVSLNHHCILSYYLNIKAKSSESESSFCPPIL